VKSEEELKEAKLELRILRVKAATLRHSAINPNSPGQIHTLPVRRLLFTTTILVLMVHAL
jgi:hypothetical protein